MPGDKVYRVKIERRRSYVTGGAKKWRTLNFLAFEAHRPGPIYAHDPKQRPNLSPDPDSPNPSWICMTWSPLVLRLFRFLSSFFSFSLWDYLPQPYDGFFILDLELCMLP